MKKKDLILPTKMLKPGDLGMDVFHLQEVLDELLKKRGRKRLTAIEPGRFGEHTREELRKFKSDRNLFTADPRYTDLTRYAMLEEFKERATTEVMKKCR